LIPSRNLAEPSGLLGNWQGRRSLANSQVVNTAVVRHAERSRDSDDEDGYRRSSMDGVRVAPVGVRVDDRGSACRIVYVDGRGTRRAVRLEQAGTVAFEDGRMVRSIPSRRGQKHAPGRYWSATTGELVEYESHLECRWMTLLDFDPRVVAFVSQPLRLEAADGSGAWEHTPDVFARRDDGSVLLLDVKETSRLGRPEVVLQHSRTAAVCRRLGWAYDMVGEPPAQRWANVSWLAGYRRPVYLGAELIDGLVELACDPIRLGDLVGAAPVAEIARPVVFHLLWRGLLVADLDSGPLRDSTVVRAWEPGR